MEKLTKKDWLNITILSILFIIFVFALIGSENLYGSKLDWNDQITAIADYFRLRFYKTFDLLPDFAFNIGSGQNIYNFSYYGLLSPYMFLSFLFPFLEMTYYLMIISILIVIISTALFYKWLKNKKFDNKLIFISSLIFMFSSGLSFHAHRHIMFIFNMPFIILSLMAVDKYFKDQKIVPLIVSVFLVIISNYYFSIGALLTITVYGIYKYFTINTKITFKDFFITGIKFLTPIIIGIMMSLIILLPTIYVILHNRSATSVTINLLEILLPKINSDFLVYNHYGIGLTAISIIALIYTFLSPKKENLILGTMLSIIIIFPFFVYLLNGTMYIDPKALIPMLPLFVLVISLFINDLIKEKITTPKFLFLTSLVLIFILFSTHKFKDYFVIDILLTLFMLFICLKIKKPNLLYAFFTIITITISYGINKIDNFMSINDFIGDNYYNQKDLINEIVNDDKALFRTTNRLNHNLNRIYNYQNNIPTIYSSTSNLEYNKFYYDIINNPIQNRNRVMTSSNVNLISNIFLGNKYMIDQKDYHLLGYEKYSQKENIIVYKNENVFPLAYATSKIMSNEDFKSLSYPDSSLALLNGIVADAKTTYTYESFLEKIDINIEDYLTNITYQKEDNKYIINSSENQYLKINLPEKYQNNLLIIEFDSNYAESCKYGDTDIYINDIRNALTCSSWKYHNGNYNFVYQIPLTEKLELDIKISKGEHHLSNFNIYALDYTYLENLKENLDEFIFDLDETNGDFIKGNIQVKEDGYFTLSIPYDKGFKIKVDGKDQNYEEVNTAFIGFPISKGYHEIEIEYEAPLKKVGLIGSSIGFIIFLGILIQENTEKSRLKKN